MNRLRHIAISAASLMAAALPAGAQTSPALRLACFPTDSYGEAYYAQDMGFFQSTGSASSSS